MATPGKAALQRLKTVPDRIPDVKVGLADFQSRQDGGAVLVSEEKVVLTQDKAAWYIDLPVFPGERDVIEGHVQFLLDQMSSGNFNPALVTMASCELLTDGQTYKINGLHTSWAKFFLPDYTPTVRELRFRAASIDELKRLYSQFDRNKSRSEAHLTKIHLVGVEGLEGLPQSLVAKLNQGLKLWLFEKKDDLRRFRAEDVARLVKDRYVGLYQKAGALYAAIGDRDFRILMRAPGLAAILATIDRAPLVAREFWGAVATGENLGKNDARLALRNYLMTAGLSSKGASSDKEIVGQEEMYRRCLVAWNKWRAGEPVQILRGTAERPRIK